MNVLKQVLQKFDDASLGLLGAVLAENECKIRDGVNAAVPCLLEAMISANEISEGRSMLWKEMRDTDATVANRFADHLYYKNSKSLLATGLDQLEGLLGAESQSLIRAVSREADLGSTSTRRLVGAVTPVVFSVIAEFQQSKQLTEEEFGNEVARQSDFLQSWRQQKRNHFAKPCSDWNQKSEPLFGDSDQQRGRSPVDGSDGLHSDQSAWASQNLFAKTAADTAESSNGRDEGGNTANGKADAFGLLSSDSDPDSMMSEAKSSAHSSSQNLSHKLSKNVDASSVTHGTVENTYDSNHPVAGFAAAINSEANEATLGEPNEMKTAAPSDQNINADEKRLWIPDSVRENPQSDSGPLYPNTPDDRRRDAAKATPPAKQRLHWLWWPVILLGSILGVSLLFPKGPTKVADGTAEANVEIASENLAEPITGDEAPGNAKPIAVIAGDLESGNQGLVEVTETKNSTDANSSITTQPPINGPDPTSDSKTDQTQNGDAAPTQKSVAVASPDAIDIADATASPDVAIKIGTTPQQTILAELSDLDADDQVEELITKIETQLSSVDQLRSTQAIKNPLSAHISALETLLADRSQWRDEIVILVDFQIDEGKHMLDAVKEKVFQVEGVEQELGPLLKLLDAILVTESN